MEAYGVIMIMIINLRLLPYGVPQIYTHIHSHIIKHTNKFSISSHFGLSEI